MDYSKAGLWVVYLNGGVYWAEEESDGYRAETMAIEALSRGAVPLVEVMHVDHTAGTVDRRRIPFDW